MSVKAQNFLALLAEHKQVIMKCETIIKTHKAQNEQLAEVLHLLTYILFFYNYCRLENKKEGKRRWHNKIWIVA
jgi:hypothetical protein